jgi:NADPH-dependent curcumin reductase CurA
MASKTSRHWILAKKPTGLPKLSGADATFRLVTKPLPPLQEGEGLVKVQYLSNDPAQRLWIDPNIAPDRLYTTPVEIEDTMASIAAIAEVVKSSSKSISVGTFVSAMTGWCEYAAIPETRV